MAFGFDDPIIILVLSNFALVAGILYLILVLHREMHKKGRRK